MLDNNYIKGIDGITVTEYSISNVKTFAFDFVDDKTYFITNDSEIVYMTTSLNNVSIPDLVVPDDFNLSSNPLSPTIANDNLQFFTAKDGANAYVVKPKGQSFVSGESFKFEKLNNYFGEYVQICTVNYGGVPKFYALASQDSIVLIDVNQVDNVNKQYVEIEKTSYIATDVNCYFLPIISQNTEFAMTTTRLPKTTVISVKKQVEFLGADYYYAEFIMDDLIYKGYIPCDFTVDVLTDDFKWDQFSLESVNKTSVYKQADMQEKIVELEQDATVRVLEKIDGICKIAYKSGDVWEIGYIYSNKIINHSQIAIRNILIILAVVACISGTLTYFLLRSKKRAN